MRYVKATQLNTSVTHEEPEPYQNVDYVPITHAGLLVEPTIHNIYYLHLCLESVGLGISYMRMKQPTVERYNSGAALKLCRVSAQGGDILHITA